jgi:two-component system NtrC family sensor kinase
MATRPDRPSGALPRPPRRAGLVVWLLPIRRSLAWRLVLLLSGSLVALLGATGFLTLRLHRQHLVQTLEQTAMGMGETILASTHASMLENDREHLRQIIEIIGGRDRVLAVRLVNASGTVSYSSRPGEVGRVADVSAPACRSCHQGGTPRAPATLREGLSFYPLPSGAQALGLAVPVLNRPECSSAGCHMHPASQRVLGLLDVELSMAQLDAAMTSAGRQMALLVLLSIVLICASVGLIAWRVVDPPIAALLRGTRQLARGDLSHRIPAVATGELQELSRSFNEMAESLEHARAELDQWSHTLEERVAQKTHELERARDQMVFAEKMASLGKLAAIVAHEINNPLAGILVSAKLVRRKLPRVCGRDPVSGALAVLPPAAVPGAALPAATAPGSPPPASPPAASAAEQELAETLVMIEREAARCGDIVRNLLLFSRRRDLSASPEDVNEIVRRSLKLLNHQVELQEIAVATQLDAELPPVICDAGQVEQAMVAMIMNAIEAMPDGGSLTVSTQRLRDGSWVRVEVADTGVGIPAELRERIFEPFFSTKAHGQGTGLGLSVLYGIVQRHQGRVDFRSEVARGTTFWIELPVTPALQAESTAQALSGTPVSRG